MGLNFKETFSNLFNTLTHIFGEKYITFFSTKHSPDIRLFFPAAISGIRPDSVVDPNTLNLDPDPGFWSTLDPDPE